MDLTMQYEKLLRYCYMKIEDRYKAEDIVQETFLRFWKSHSYNNTGKEMAYLYTIARNLCMDVSDEMYRDVLGYLPQDFGYYPNFTGKDFQRWASAFDCPSHFC